MSEKEKSLVSNAADEEQIRKATTKEKSKQDLEAEDMRKLLRTPFGQRVIWKYLKMCGVFRSVWSSDSREHAFNDGKREIGLKIMGDCIESDEAVLMDMMSAGLKK